MSFTTRPYHICLSLFSNCLFKTQCPSQLLKTTTFLKLMILAICIPNFLNQPIRNRRHVFSIFSHFQSFLFTVKIQFLFVLYLFLNRNIKTKNAKTQMYTQNFANVYHIFYSMSTSLYFYCLSNKPTNIPTTFILFILIYILNAYIIDLSDMIQS